MPKRRRTSASSSAKKKKTKQPKTAEVQALDQEGYWEIERVVNVRTTVAVASSSRRGGRRRGGGGGNNAKRLECLVKWKGFEEPSWEPAEHLTEAAWHEAQALLEQHAAEKLGLAVADADALVEEAASGGGGAGGGDVEVDEGHEDEEEEDEEEEDAKPAAKKDTSVQDRDEPQREDVDDAHFVWSTATGTAATGAPPPIVRPIERLSVWDAGTARRVAEARWAGVPLVLTGAAGWAHFARRWLVLPPPESKDSGDGGSGWGATAAVAAAINMNSETAATAAAAASASAEATEPTPTKDPAQKESSVKNGETGDKNVEETVAATNESIVVAAAAAAVELASAEATETTPTKDPAQKESPVKETAAATNESIAAAQTTAASEPAVQETSAEVAPATPPPSKEATPSVDNNDVVVATPKDDGRDDNDPPLDLSLPYQLDIQKMMDDVGDELVPILRKHYDATDPIKEELKLSRFLKSNCWPSSKEDNDDNKKDDANNKAKKKKASSSSNLYVHQWLFTASDTAKTKLCGGRNHQPLPNNILGDDLLRYWYDPEQCAGDSPYQYLFMGNTGTESRLHRDKGGLLITIAPIVGRKEVTLVHRADGASSLYHLAASVDEPDLHKFPLLYSARVWKTVVEPGEIVMLPQGTYHQCRNLSPCLSYHHFHLDTVNLKAFFESWRDRDTHDIEHETVIWNATTDLTRRVDTFVEELRLQPPVQRPAAVPDDVVSAVESLRTLVCICREMALHRHAMTEYGAEAWNNIVTDVETSLHDFRYRRRARLPPFRSAAAMSRGKNGGKKNYATGRSQRVQYKQQQQHTSSPGSLIPSVQSDKFVSAFERITKLKPESQGVVLSDQIALEVGDAVVVRLHDRAVGGRIIGIQEDMFGVMVHYEGYSTLEDQFVPLDQLRVHVPGGGGVGAEVHPSSLREGMVVYRLDENREEYLSLVRFWRQATFYRVCLLLDKGEIKFEQWLTRDYFMQLVQAVLRGGLGAPAATTQHASGGKVKEREEPAVLQGTAEEENQQTSQRQQSESSKDNQNNNSLASILKDFHHEVTAPQSPDGAHTGLSAAPIAGTNGTAAAAIHE